MGIFKSKKRLDGESILHLKPATKVEICFENDDNEKFYSKLLYVVSEKELVIISLKNSEGKLVKLPQKRRYKMTLKTPQGLFENLINIKSYELEDGISIVRIVFLEPTKKIQRRQSFRLPIEIEFKFVYYKGDDESNPDEVLKGLTVDVSNGGLKFKSNKEMEVEDTIRILINIQDVNIVVKSTILQKEELHIKDEYKFMYKCKFEDIPQKYKDELSKYIFEKQRELLKSGTLKLDN